MRFAIDMDDTLVALSDQLIKCLNMEYGCHKTKADFNPWGWHSLDDLFEDDTTWWDWLQRRTWLWAKADAIPGAIGGIEKLRGRGHKIELLTSKPEWAEWVVWAWLGKWRPAVHSVIIVGDHQCKADVSDADVLVDDGMHNIMPWVETGRRAIIFDQPWNHDHLGAKNAIRAYTWADVLDLDPVLNREKWNQC